MVWPVKLSSTCPVRSPVCSHCRANCFWERLAISMVMTTEMGTVMRQITARSGLIQNIIDKYPDEGQDRRDDLGERLLHRLLDVVDVVRDPAEDVAPRVAVEILEGQAGKLEVDIPAQPVDHAGRPLRP